MFTQFTSFAIATAIAGTAMSSSPIDTADVNELRDMVRQLRDEVAELKVEQGQSWLSEQRADEVRLLVHDVLSDADTRASLQGSGAQSGYDGGFFIASDNGNFKLKISGLLQTRWLYNNAEGATSQHGFEQRRTKVKFSGYIIDPSWEYIITPTWGRAGGSNTEDASIIKSFDDGSFLRFGQWKAPFLREQLLSSAKQLSVERSMVNTAFTYGWTQGIGYGWDGDDMSFAVMYGDGPGQANTQALSNPTDSITARVEFLAGDASWKDFDYLTSRAGGETGAMFGAAVEWFDTDGTATHEYGNATSTQSLGWTVDASFRGDGWNVFAYGVWTSGEDGSVAGSPETDSWGFVLQGGFLATDNWELFARYERGEIENATFAAGSNDLSAMTLGANYWPVAGNNSVKWTTDWGYAFDSIAEGGGLPNSSADWATPGTGWRGDTGANDGQWLLRTQLQLAF